MPLLHNPVLHRAIIDDLVLRAKQMQPAVRTVHCMHCSAHSNVYSVLD